MIVAGAGGHAKDLTTLLHTEQKQNLVFFDNVNKKLPPLFLDTYPIISSQEEVKKHFRKERNYIIGIGGTSAREKIAKILTNLGGELQSIISSHSIIGIKDIYLGKGLNIMPFVLISNSVHIGDGCLINNRASLHHDVVVGDFCEIGPSSTLLGGVHIDNYTSIGAGSTVLPDVKIGSNCIIGAGSLITKNVPDNSLVFGSPGKIIKAISPI
ncbi:MAG: NeuD/PglB/VioB family sugar acetyltransferase [Balneola sp.]